VTDWLLDTNVVSELRRPRPDAGVVDFLEAYPIETFFLPSIVIAEIRYGIALLDSPEKRSVYEDWLQTTVRPMFEGRILQLTEDALVRWRIIAREGRRQGYTFPEPDLLIAAMAIENGMTVVTRNTSDFERAGVLVFNPWSSRSHI
jgi:predicted nucleic acid-binding protein